MSDSPKFKVRIPSAEELAKRKPKDFMDAIEFGMISSSQLGKADDFPSLREYIEQRQNMPKSGSMVTKSMVTQYSNLSKLSDSIGS